MAVFDTLRTLNASGSKMPVMAVEIFSDKLTTPICLVQAQQDMSLKDANGTTRTFTACGISISLPERNTSGFSDVSLAIGDTRGIAMGYCSQVVNNDGTANLYVLEYLPGETTPVYKLRLSMTSAEITPKQATFTAGWHDCLNRRFPYMKYSARHFKGLRYVS